MDLRSLSLGERIAGLSGAALFVFMFVPWLEGRTAWQYFSLVDVLLALIALLAVALPLLKATGSAPAVRTSTATALSRAGLVALAITATFLVEGTPRNVGIFLAVLASAGILYGGMTTPEEGGERAPRRRRGERPRRAYTTEDFEEPPPGMDEGDWRPSARSWGAEDFEAGERSRVGESTGRDQPTEVREPREPRPRPEDVPPAGA
jgi:hypothetical protein